MYFAPRTLPDPGVTLPFRPPVRTDALFLDVHDGETPMGDYAMWWREDNASFPEAEARASLDRVYAVLDRVASYAMVGVARAAGWIPPDVQAARVALPDDLAVGAVRGPEGRVLLVSASAEKGIRFHFHTETTPPAYRDRYLRVVASYFEGMAGSLADYGLEPDAPEGSPPSAWWSAVQASLQSMGSEHGAPQKLGLIPVNDA
ncbi:MAG: hypothetical protein AAGJ11_15865 [Bacteroidota bacterium]